MKAGTLRDQIGGIGSGKKGKAATAEKKEPVKAEKVKAAAAEVEAAGKNDFRDLPEPQRTNARTLFILRHKELTATMKVAAAIIVQEFFGVEDHRKTMNISELFPAPEYTSRTRITTLAQLEKLGLIRREVRRGDGQDIILNF